MFQFLGECSSLGNGIIHGGKREGKGMERVKGVTGGMERKQLRSVSNVVFDVD